MEHSFQTIGIVGMGLIGASFARAIMENMDATVFAHDLNEEVLQKAQADGVIAGHLNDHIDECDMILIALYPAAAIQWVQENGARIAGNTIVIDCCGVKRAVAPDLKRLAEKFGFTYVGGHPMAGRELSGYDASQADLFFNASMILTDLSQELEADLTNFFKTLGFARIQKSTPEEHDHIIAYTSQLAHVLSSAYVKAPTALTHTGFSAGSFRDMTRVAYLNESMWTELFLDNAEYLADEVDGLCARLAQYSAAIRSKDRDTLFALLKEGRERKELVEGLQNK
ncbi:MAG: prephenate dehydrogenase [Clostridia bacterium]|nr:prephenate dehydrogenase [Clostridia bacterium]